MLVFTPTRRQFVAWCFDKSWYYIPSSWRSFTRTIFLNVFFAIYKNTGRYRVANIILNSATPVQRCAKFLRLKFTRSNALRETKRRKKSQLANLIRDE